ncbi:PadR family transcriptional regulator [Paenibacillus lycopersici]|uniref:PadR family transcriptional regulator n=1 Tax=Paenibacillus lycopersici TaxID=2704462 RepID=A0A6C0G2I2_9BACL|nr:helix-turn-helix transcriptional regulator [Paenibacillus lycopersici]QHT63586.1 PadR family transcriptional regulator [Paenibacillus lycopersici]
MKINKELLKGSTVILIMKLLENKDMYGYEMAKRIELQSDGLFTFKEGTLYPILHTLEVERLVEAYWGEEGGRKRKYYRLTQDGQKALIEKEREWTLFSSAVNRIIGEGRA